MRIPGLSMCVVLFAGWLVVSANELDAARTDPRSDHRAYQPPRLTSRPQVRDRDWCRNGIDFFCAEPVGARRVLNLDGLSTKG